MTDSRRPGQPGASARRREDLVEQLTGAKRERPWADTWWEDGAEEFDRAVLSRMTFAQARTIADACRGQGRQSIADWCYETYSREWRLSWLPGNRNRVGDHLCRIAGRFPGDVRSDVESIRTSLGRAMTRWIALTYLTGVALLGIGIVVGAAFYSPLGTTRPDYAAIGGAAMFGGFLLITLIYPIVGKRVFGSRVALFSWTKSIRFQRQLFSYGIRVAWRNGVRGRSSSTAP